MDAITQSVYSTIKIRTKLKCMKEVLVSLYPWEAWTPDLWTSIVLAITRVLMVHRFSPNCYKHHQLWRQESWRKSPDAMEALRFADFLTRDRDFRGAIRQFNKQAHSQLRYGEWLLAFDKGDSADFSNHIAQIGGWIYNAMAFLRKTHYLVVYGDLTKIIRPKRAPPTQRAFEREWGKQTCEYIDEYLMREKKYPPLKKVADYWKVPRYTLVEAGYTRDVILEMYRNYRKTGVIKVLKLVREYRIPNEEDQNRIAENISRRIYGDTKCQLP